MSGQTSITGGCQCGAVRYVIKGALGKASICHCRMCQKAFGSFFGPFVSVERNNFELTRGTLSMFRSSDAAERGFCRDCGTPLSFQFVGTEQIDLAIGSLDKPELARPADQIGIEGRLPWFAELAGLPERTTEAGDTPERLSLIAQSNRQHPDHDTRDWLHPGAGSA